MNCINGFQLWKPLNSQGYMCACLGLLLKFTFHVVSSSTIPSYLMIFLKFVQAVIPTIEYDFTRDFTM